MDTIFTLNRAWHRGVHRVNKAEYFENPFAKASVMPYSGSQILLCNLICKRPIQPLSTIETFQSLSTH